MPPVVTGYGLVAHQLVLVNAEDYFGHDVLLQIVFGWLSRVDRSGIALLARLQSRPDWSCARERDRAEDGDDDRGGRGTAPVTEQQHERRNDGGDEGDDHRERSRRRGESGSFQSEDQEEQEPQDRPQQPDDAERGVLDGEK